MLFGSRFYFLRPGASSLWKQTGMDFGHRVRQCLLKTKEPLWTEELKKREPCTKKSEP